MLRVNMVHEVEKIKVVDVSGDTRVLEFYSKEGNIYIGPTQVLFNRDYVMKDKHRIQFTSKLDTHQNELLHISVILDKIRTNQRYSYFSEQVIREIVYDKGFTDEDLYIKDKTYSCSKEMFIEFGFNSMNFCLDRRGDIWVHYKPYEEQKQYRSIVKALKEEDVAEFRAFYKKIHRFVRYIDMGNSTADNASCFTLKSINITKLYYWLKDKSVLHSVSYVSEIYNDTLRELSFNDISKDDYYIKVISTNDGLKIKNNECVYNSL